MYDETCVRVRLSRLTCGIPRPLFGLHPVPLTELFRFRSGRSIYFRPENRSVPGERREPSAIRDGLEA